MEKSQSSASPAATRALKRWINAHFPLYWWYIVAAFIGFLTLLHILHLTTRRLRLPSLVRRHLGVCATGMNIVLYRTSPPLRSLHQMNWAEGFVTLGYFVTSMVLGFARSANIRDPGVGLLSCPSLMLVLTL